MKTVLVGVKMVDIVTNVIHIMLAILIVPPIINKKASFIEEHTIDKRIFRMFINIKDAVVRVKLLTKVNSPDSNTTHDYRLEENRKFSNISIVDIVEPTLAMTDSDSIDRENYIAYTKSESVQFNRNNKPSTHFMYHIQTPDFEWLQSHCNVI